MGWVFTKQFESGPDGYYYIQDCTENGCMVPPVQKYGSIPSGFAGTLYTDGNEGQPEHEQKTTFIGFKKYYTLKKNIMGLNVKLSNYAPDEELTDIEKKAKKHRESFYNQFAPIINAIKEIENE